MRDEYDQRPDPPDWLSPDYTPDTEPEGQQPPPPNEPPTAVGASSDDPSPPPQRFMERWRRPGWQPESSLGQLTTDIFDALDRVGDRIAEGLGLR